MLPSCSPPGTMCLLPSLHVSFELHHVEAHENGAQLGASLIESTQVRLQKTSKCELRISDPPLVSLKPAPLGSGPCSPQSPQSQRGHCRAKASGTLAPLQLPWHSPLPLPVTQAAWTRAVCVPLANPQSLPESSEAPGSSILVPQPQSVAEHSFL